MKTRFKDGRRPIKDVPTHVSTIYPTQQLQRLNTLLTKFELDPRVLPNLKAALRALEQADRHLRAGYALAEIIEQGL